ncbi:MAG: cbb3-type cytochrome c oxidase subunit 3 [Rhodobacteraceae bacterium]|nr:MAG: cbb3-type cytochrome c oxidase subunit 3 [Paracoccaceae bacterium]
MSHDLLVYLSKTVGLVWLMGFFVIVVIRAYSPKRKAAHDRAARSILGEESDDA